MKRSSSAAVLVTAVLLLSPSVAWCQAEPAEATPEEQPLDAEILSAKKIFILNTVMDFSLANAFISEVMDWERFEVVYSEEDADLCFALSAQADYQKEEIPSGGAENDIMPPRTVGTMRTLDSLYFKIFKPGGDDLWRDEEAVGDDSEAAVELVRRLRERIEQQEAAAAADAS